MKISYNWLQQHIEETLPSVEEIEQKIIFHAFEVETLEEIGSDVVFDIKVLPDRARDCLSHLGIAREIAGLLKLTLKEKTAPMLPEISEEVPVDLQSELCRVYMATRIDGVKVAPSPKWLKDALESIGQKSINNIVDATNFVLNDIGQPVHAFDTAKIDGGIVVRLAKEGETIKLLGGEEKTLKESDLVIADYLGTVAIAGVKGGATAEVTEMTTSIIIEVANFDPTAVRKTSRRLALITDASKRFENNFSPAFTLPAMQQVVALITELAGGSISAQAKRGIAVSDPRTISFSLTDITRILGSSITDSNIDDVLTRYRYEYKKEGDLYTLVVPHWRADLMGPHDIAEEIGRVIGYDKIPSTSLPFTPTLEQNQTDIQITAVKAWCIENNFREVYNYTFCNKGEVAVAYGAKGKEKLRSNLSDALKDSYELNRLNAPLLGLKEVKLFEVGTIFFTDREEVHVALCDKGTIQELSLSDFIKEKNILLEPISLAQDITDPAPFIAWSTYPFITRDVAVWLSDTEGKNALLEKAEVFTKKHCARPPFLFDEFSKEGRTSIALRFVFQATDRTLTDTEVTTLFGEFLIDINEIEGAKVR